jgi:uncharacterized metal-binding protein YceD (DUF177 family)
MAGPNKDLAAMIASENEFSHIIKLDEIGAGSSQYAIAADDRARGRLTERFDLIALDRLDADIALVREGQNIHATGHMRAHVVQACIASGDPVATDINEPIDIMFTPETEGEAEVEIELAQEDCDIMFHDGRIVDLGEAVAQSLGLALNPYPRRADAEAVLKAAGIKADDEVEAFGALSGLKDLLKGK